MSSPNEPNVIDTFWISGNVPSSKNSRVWTGQYFVPSLNTRKYKKETKVQWLQQRIWFNYLVSTLEKPLYIEFTFVRKSRHKFDYINICQILNDLMQEYSWISGDDADVIKPYFGDYKYDKKNPGVIIKLLKHQPNHYDIPQH